MKILAIGDFHGKFPVELQKLAKECDLIFYIGDLSDTSKLREMEFKYWNLIKKKGDNLEKTIGKAKYKKLIIPAINSMNKMLKIL